MHNKDMDPREPSNSSHKAPAVSEPDRQGSECQVEFPVEGMTCAACTGRVERALKKVPGVAEASVNLATNRATVTFDPSKAGPSDLTSAVSRAGYTPVVQKVEIFQEDMTDPGSEKRVTDVLLRLPGVLSAEILAAQNRIIVSFLGGTIREKDLLSALSKAGYSGSILDRDKENDSGETKYLASMRQSLLVSGVLSVPVLFFSMGLSFFPSLRPAIAHILPVPFGIRFLEFLLTASILLGPGLRFVRPGLAAYRHGAPDMNSLVITGTGAAFLYSTLVTFFPEFFPRPDRHVYFDSAAVVITVILLGRYLEALAKGRTGQSIEALLKLAPSEVVLVGAEKERTVSVREIHPGDRVRVRPGDRIPVDGVLLDHPSHVDLSMMTGEPVPVLKKPGESVVCGTVNLDALITVEAVSVGADTRLAQIIRAVQRAQGAKLPVQRLADRIVMVFTPVVLGVALLTFLSWLLLGSGGIRGAALAEALVSSVAVLVVACPCAMGLATPAAVMVGSGRGAELGVLFRKGEALETLSKVDTVLFDKTGTLTLGHPRVVRSFPEEPAGALLEAASVESASSHPLGRAILVLARERGMEVPSPESASVQPGKGVRGRVGGADILVGSRRFLLEEGVDLSGWKERSSAWEAEGLTLLFMARDKKPVAIFGVSDPVKPEAREVVQALEGRGITVGMITGDQEVSARTVADQVGIRTVLFQVSPEEKSGVVERFRKEGHRVAFVGDGINDGPALAAAEVGVALGTGTDVAIEAADLTLAGSDLRNVLTALDLSKQTMRTIRMNLLWAFLYNILLIPLAAGVFRPVFGFGLNPMLAGTAMGLSSVFVVTNSLRLRAFSPVSWPNPPDRL